MLPLPDGNRNGDLVITTGDSTVATGSSRSPGRYEKGIRRRQEILDRALEVFNERGFEATSLRAIGEAIGVSHSALTHYFESREALLLEVLGEWDRRAEEFSARRAHESLAEVLVSATEYNTSVPGLTALNAILTARALESNSEQSRTFFASRFERARQIAVNIIVVSQQAGQIRDDLDAEDLAALVIAASDGLSTQWLLDPSVRYRACIEMLERLARPGDRAPQTP